MAQGLSCPEALWGLPRSAIEPVSLALQGGFLISRVRSPTLVLSEARRTKTGREGCSWCLGVPWVASFFWAPSISVQGLVPGRDLLLWEGRVDVH